MKQYDSQDRLALEKAEEIEITPQMIEAGKRELFGFNPDLDSSAEVVERIIRAAMARIRTPET